MSRLRPILKSPLESSGASNEALEAAMSRLGYRLPEDYLDFLRMTNGYDGDVGESGYVYVWPVEELAPSNEANNFREWLPGLVLFGSDGIGNFYAFDMRHSPAVVLCFPSIGGPEPEVTEEVGKSFLGFLKNLAR
jgi:hypothetical protein